MLCFIYKSLKKNDLYLYLNKKDDFSLIPQPLYNHIGTPEFVMQLELTPETTLAKENPRNVIQQLQEKGFFIQMPPTQLPIPEKIQ